MKIELILITIDPILERFDQEILQKYQAKLISRMS